MSAAPKLPDSDFSPPHPLQFKGNALAKAVLNLFGWKVLFDGLPTRQGILIVYPHTSNWDFFVMIMAKWSVGVQVSFWGKHQLFGIPLVGAWLRWLGGVPVLRTAPQGVVGQAVDIFRQKQRDNEVFWLGLAPEGTRRPLAGWRSGFYRTAVQAHVPVGLIHLDFGRRTVDVRRFVWMSGDVDADFQRMARVFDGVKGRIPEYASPIRLLDPDVPRSDTISK